MGLTGDEASRPPSPALCAGGQVSSLRPVPGGVRVLEGLPLTQHRCHGVLGHPHPSCCCRKAGVRSRGSATGARAVVGPQGWPRPRFCLEGRAGRRPDGGREGSVQVGTSPVHPPSHTLRHARCRWQGSEATGPLPSGTLRPTWEESCEVHSHPQGCPGQRRCCEVGGCAGTSSTTEQPIQCSITILEGMVVLELARRAV